MGLHFSGLAGAVLAVPGTVGYTEFRDWRRRVSERAGPTRLLINVIGSNESRQLVSLQQENFNTEDGEPSKREILQIHANAPPSVGAWVASRAQLAQLMEPEDFSMIISSGFAMG